MTIFSKQLQNLTKIRDTFKDITKQNIALKKQVDNATNALGRLKKVAVGVLGVFKNIYAMVKNIGFASLGFMGGAGIKGMLAQKNVASAKRIGINTQEQGALKHTGGVLGVDRDFFTTMAKTLRESTYTPEGNRGFSILGIRDAGSKKTMDLLMEFLQNSKTMLDRYQGDQGRLNSLQEAVSQVAGINLGDLKTFDLEAFKKAYEEGIGYANNSQDKLQSIGVGLNRVITSFDAFVNKTLASVSKPLESVFTNITNGLKEVGNSKAFERLLAKVGSFADTASKGFGSTMETFIKNIPQILREIQITFLRVLQGLAEASTWILVGESDRKATEFAKRVGKKADTLEAQQLRDEIMESKKPTQEFANKLTRLSELHKQGTQLSQEDRSDLINHINIVVNNDPTQAQQSQQMQQSINLSQKRSK